MSEWIVRLGMEIGPLATWVMLLTQFVVVPTIVWLRQQLRAPLHRLDDQMDQQRRKLHRVHMAVEELSKHVARQNGRIGALETRFSEHTAQDQVQQTRLHEDLRTLYLHVTPPLPKRD